MRKRNILKTADTIFWYTLYLLPVVGYLIYVSAFGQNPGFNSSETGVNAIVISFQSFMSYSGLLPHQGGIVYTTLSNIFGNTSGAIMPLFLNSVILIVTYYVNLFIMHLVVDFLLFIPKLAMKYMDEFTKE